MNPEEKRLEAREEILKKIRAQRLIEISVGIITWLAITSSIWASFLIPNIMAYFIILMAVYWFYRSANFAFSSIIGFYQIKKNERVNWLKLAKQQKDFDKVLHLIIIPNYKEHQEKLKITLQHLAAQDLPTQKIGVVLGMEEREGHQAKEKAKNLIKEFKDRFGFMIATFHPDLPGELKGKASNQAWAGKMAKKELVDKRGFDINFITISSCDADSLFPPQYFSYLTYLFLTNPNRYRRFWQGLLTEYANIERAVLPIKMLSAISSVVRMSLPFQGGFFTPYSTYSTSLKMVDKVGYWDVDIMPEDWHIFFKSYFSFRGEVKTEPIYLAIHGDAIEGKTFVDALKNRYEQNRRHAWGVTDIPYIFQQWFLHPEIPLIKKTILAIKAYEAHFLWPTSWFLLTLGVNLPPIINPKLKETVLGYNSSVFAKNILTICLIFTLAFIVLDLISRPRKAKGERLVIKILSIVQWIFMPFITLFLSALPGLDAHTRLMLNRRIEYKVVEKMVDAGKEERKA